MNSRRLIVGGLLLAWMTCCSCGASDPPAQAGGNPFDISDVVYVGQATDEALLRLLDAAPKDDARHYVVIDSPDLGAAVPRDVPPTFTFHLASEATRVRSHRARPASPGAPAWQRSLWDLARLFGPLRVAQAHGVPYNGVGYFMVFTDVHGQTRLRVFTSQPSYAPDAAAWQSLVQAPQPLTIEVRSAFFEENEIPDDGGPFLGGSFELRIQ